MIKTDLLRLVLEIPKNADDELMRIKTRLIITLLFKPLRNKNLIMEGVELLNGELPESVELLFKRLHERLGEEIKTDKQSLQTQLSLFTDKILSFELTNIDKGGYVQFMNLISQIVAEIALTNVSIDQKVAVFTSQNVTCSMVKSFNDL